MRDTNDILQNEPKGPSSTYHDGVNKSHNVDWPDRAEASDDSEDEVVFGFGAVHRGVGGDTRMA